jgi:hypothetical protein
MTSKRLRSDFSYLPDTPEAALATVHQLMRQFNIKKTAILKDNNSGPDLSLFCLEVRLC